MSDTRDRIVPLGDAALLVPLGAGLERGTLARVRATASALATARPAGVLDIVAAYGTVAVHFDPRRIARGAVAEWLARTIEPCATAGDAAGVAAPPVHSLPVVYGGAFGPDLEEIAERSRLTPAAVIELHAAGRYVVAAIGFTPGFAYLAGLAPELATPRRSTPRLVVAAGSVAIGGPQTGIYSIESPGGWHVIGQTPARLFDPGRTPAALLAGGDEVRFEPIGARAFARRLRTVTAARHAVPARAVAAFEVVDGGTQSALQDLGRPGFAAQGIAPGGALDRLALLAANRLVGNPPEAAALEFALTGPRLRVLRPLRIAVAGARVVGIACGRPLELAAGSLLDLRELRHGARAYLAVAGGFAASPVLGSRSTELRAHFGGHAGRALQAGDQLEVPAAKGRAASRAGTRSAKASLLAPTPTWWVDSALLCDRPRFAPLRVVRGPQAEWFHDDAWASFLARAWTLTPRSDRMGLRLAGPPLPLLPEVSSPLAAAPRELLSEGVASGTIQVPPDGHPIVLLGDRPTIGGYPKLATVISADLGRAAQLRPGETVRFEEVSLAAADAALAMQERELARLDVALQLRGVHGTVR